MKTLVGFYFSGTGNTRYIAEYLCEKLSAAYRCELYDIAASPELAERAARADVLLFAFPVYGSAPPIPMRKFVHRCGPYLRGKQTLLAETQYFFSGDGAATIGRTVEKYGGRVIGAETFNMPNNLADCKLFPIKNGEEIEKTLARARRRADRFAARVVSGNAKRRGFSVFSHCLGYFSQRKYWRRGEDGKRDRLKIDPSRCIRCGACARNCPAGNLILQGERVKPLGECVLCYRCVNLCPRKAISLLGSAPPETQYRGPREGKKP